MDYLRAFRQKCDLVCIVFVDIIMLPEDSHSGRESVLLLQSQLAMQTAERTQIPLEDRALTVLRCKKKIGQKPLCIGEMRLFAEHLIQ